MSSSLYREEALSHAGQRHLGEPQLQATRPLLLMTTLLTGALAIAVLLVSNTEFARKQPVSGHIDTSTTRTMIASDFGYLTGLSVAEGQRVSAGDEIGRIVSRPVAPENQRERLRQVQNLERQSALSSQALDQGIRHASGRDRQLNQISRLAREDIRLQSSKVLQLQLQVERTARLHRSGYLSSLDYLRLEQSLISEQQNLNALKKKLASIYNQRLALRQSLDELRQHTSRQLADIELKQSQLRQHQLDRDTRDSQRLIATTNGRISRIEVAEGASVAPGQAILYIDETVGDLTGSVLLPSQAMGKIGVGQRLMLTFDAYPEDTYGKVPSTITNLRAPGPQEGHAMFIARLSIAPSSEQQRDKPLNLLPGMTFTANVIVESKSLLAWMTRPLNAMLDRI